MPVGLLFATMEPPANIEEEFQDWYDTEHFPERQACPGFLTANRFVCIEGWPRYLAMYDLEDVEVLRGEGYHKIAHGRYSAWTHRIIPKVTGQYRAEGVQVYPGDAIHGKAGTSSRTLVVRFRSVQDEAALVAGLRKAFEGRPQTTQLRVYNLLLTPQMPVGAWSAEAGADEGAWINGKFAPSIFERCPFTYPFNLTSQPAATVPCGFTAEGLPVGLQIVGRWHDESTVFRAAACFEAIQPWAGLRPAVEQRSSGSRVPGSA